MSDVEAYIYEFGGEWYYWARNYPIGPFESFKIAYEHFNLYRKGFTGDLSEEEIQIYMRRTLNNG